MNRDKEIVLNKGRVTFHTDAAIGQMRTAHHMLRELSIKDDSTDYTHLLEEYETTIAIMQSLDITGRKIMEIKQQYELKKRRKSKHTISSGRFASTV